MTTISLNCVNYNVYMEATYFPGFGRVKFLESGALEGELLESGEESCWKYSSVGATH